MEKELTLTKEQKIEYQTVMLAGLLHDIGKFLGRIERHRYPKHPLASVLFLNQPIIATILKRDGMEIDVELLETLVQRHHEYYTFPDNQQVKTITDPHQRALAYMVSRADSFSSQERDDEEDPAFQNYKKYRIHSTFSLIHITDEKKNDRFYQLQEFTPGTMSPVNKVSLDRTTYSYENLEPAMMDMFGRFQPENFAELFNGFLNIFKKFLWAVPSDTWKKKSDISLFDHLSTTSALAASLYLYHRDDWNEGAIKNDKTEKFLLVGGDLSGIQDFLFEIHQQNPRKLSKTLRGRSFLLSALVDLTSLKILKALQLPYSAKLMSSGGRFVILAPNRDWVKEKLAQLAAEIEEEFFGTFLGKLTLAINCQTTLSGQDLALGEFKKKINDCNAGLIRQKLHKNLSIFQSEKYRQMLAQPHGYSLQANHTCSFCGIYPKEEAGEDNKCKICNASEALGEKILHAQFLQFSDGPGIFRFLDMGIDLTEEYKPGIFSYALEENINTPIYRGTVFHSIANYLPMDNHHGLQMVNDDKNSFCHYCQRNNLETECQETERRIFKESHLSFQCIAAAARFKRGGKGTEKLAVFKADIDNLGYIAQFGFEKLDVEETSIYSVSRYTFLSRMIDGFLQYQVKQFIKEKFPMVYTVYAGGDDLLLIGPWNDMVKFSLEFYQLFKIFVGDNPDMTLSAGISLFSPFGSVGDAVAKAQHSLELSKNSEGKDAITLFDTTVHWQELEELFHFAEFLDNRIKDEESKIKVAFLYRMFKYHRMFMEAADENKIEGLRFHSLMAYDITRNIAQKKDDRIINPEEIERLRPLYATGDDLNKNLLRHLKIPLYMALLENRGGK